MRQRLLLFRRPSAGALTDLAPELLGPGDDGSAAALPGDVITTIFPYVFLKMCAVAPAVLLPSNRFSRQVPPEVAAERMRVSACACRPGFHSTCTFFFSNVRHARFAQAFIASSLADVRRHLNAVNLPMNCESSSALLRAEQQLQVAHPHPPLCSRSVADVPTSSPSALSPIQLLLQGRCCPPAKSRFLRAPRWAPAAAAAGRLLNPDCLIPCALAQIALSFSSQESTGAIAVVKAAAPTAAAAKNTMC